MWRPLPQVFLWRCEKCIPLPWLTWQMLQQSCGVVVFWKGSTEAPLAPYQKAWEHKIVSSWWPEESMPNKKTLENYFGWWQHLRSINCMKLFSFIREANNAFPKSSRLHLAIPEALHSTRLDCKVIYIMTLARHGPWKFISDRWPRSALIQTLAAGHP